MKRLTAIDVLRGILLLLMVVNHSPSVLRRFTDQPLGFFTTAEAFVFVSAFLAGMLFLRKSDQHGFAVARASTVSRSWRIYRAHLLTLVFAFTLGSFFLPEFPGAKYLLDHYLKNPVAAIPASGLLLLRPPLMDILPLYILFSCLTPLVFWLAQRWGWKIVIGISSAVWLISQTRILDLVMLPVKDIPYIELGPFDFLAWQFLWVSGLFLGQRFEARKANLAFPGSVRAALVFLAIGFLAWRWSSVWTGVDPSHGTWLLDKWHLGPIRLLNFFVTCWVISKFLKHLEYREALLRPLSQIGRHMLPVFCWQICLSILLVCGIETRNCPQWLMSFLVLCQLATALGLAWLFEARSRQRANGIAQLRLSDHGRQASVSAQLKAAGIYRPAAGMLGSS